MENPPTDEKSPHWFSSLVAIASYREDVEEGLPPIRIRIPTFVHVGMGKYKSLRDGIKPDSSGVIWVMSLIDQHFGSAVYQRIGFASGARVPGIFKDDSPKEVFVQQQGQ